MSSATQQVISLYRTSRNICHVGSNRCFREKKKTKEHIIDLLNALAILCELRNIFFIIRANNDISISNIMNNNIFSTLSTSDTESFRICIDGCVGCTKSKSTTFITNYRRSKHNNCYTHPKDTKPYH